MSSTAEVRRVCPETGFPFAEVLYTSSGERLFRRGVVGYVGHGYVIRFAVFRISTGGKSVVGVFWEEDFDSCQQIFPLPRSNVVDERSCPKVEWGILGHLKEGEHVCKGLQFDFHPSLGQLQRVGSKILCTLLVPCHCPFFPFLLVQAGGLFLPCPLETARAADLTSVSLYCPVIFLIPCMPCLKISFFLPMPLLSSRLF